MQCSNLLSQISGQGVISISPQMKLSIIFHAIKNALFSTLVKHHIIIGDMPCLAWPGSPGLGLAWALGGLPVHHYIVD
jgi:hypothetical protein